MGKSEKGLHESERQKKDPEETKKPSMEQLLKLTWGCASMEELESMLTSYLSELEPCARISGSAIASANEKKQKILQRLIIFNSIYENIPKPKYDFDYFRKMSDLLVHYITLEVFTASEPFKCETEDIKNLISRIVTTMYVSLGFSEDHILDTVMKLVVSVDEKTPKKDFSIYSELFKIVVRKAEKQQVNDFTYIRYILVYRLWKKIMKVQAGSDQSIDEISKLKDTIFKKAKVLLPPPGFTKKLRVLPSVLPKLPPEVLEQPPSCITDFFLRVKFSVRKAVEKFLEVSYDGAMFPNLSCNPILLNPKPRDSVFLGPSDPIQEFSTVVHAGDDIWQRLHDERLSETSVFLQVTKMKNTPICTPDRMLNVLRSHYKQDMARKAHLKYSVFHKALFGDRPGAGVVTNYRIPGSHSEEYGGPSQNIVCGRAGTETLKRRMLDASDNHHSKKSREDSHLSRPAYAEACSVQKDKFAQVYLFSEIPPRSEGISESIGEVSDSLGSTAASSSGRVDFVGRQSCPNHCPSPGKLVIEKVVEQTLQLVSSGVSSTAKTSNVVGTDLMEELNSRTSCPSLHHGGPVKPAIKNEMDQTLPMFDTTRSTAVLGSPSWKERELKLSGLETPTCVRTDVTPNSMWGSLGYSVQPDDDSWFAL